VVVCGAPSLEVVAPLGGVGAVDVVVPLAVGLTVVELSALVTLDGPPVAEAPVFEATLCGAAPVIVLVGPVGAGALVGPVGAGALVGPVGAEALVCVAAAELVGCEAAVAGPTFVVLVEVVAAAVVVLAVVFVVALVVLAVEFAGD
jgi:hypothetical protein